MILTIDAGNTSITIGAYKGEESVFFSRISTDKLKMADQYACDFINMFSLNNVDRNSFSGCIISCVVPEITNSLERAVENVIGKKPIIIGPGVKTGLNILVDNPAQVGSDIVAGAVGAVIKYEMPCIVIDLGTASKIMALDENGSFCGLTINCGVKVSLDALAKQASLLPNISIRPPKHVIGKNTIDCMQSGTVFGTAAMIDGLIDRFQKEMKSPIKTIVGTGGYAKNIISNCEKEIIYDENLVLDGLKAIYYKNKK